MFNYFIKIFVYFLIWLLRVVGLWREKELDGGNILFKLLFMCFYELIMVRIIIFQKLDDTMFNMLVEKLASFIKLNHTSSQNDSKT